jgi:glucose/arabinose dehydrogenase
MGPMMEPRRPFAAALLSVLLAACSASSTSPTPDGSTGRAEPTATATPAAPSPTARPTATPDPTPEPISDEPPPLALTAVASGFASPIGIAPAPGGWLMINERNGRVIALDPASGETRVTLDLTGRVLGNGEQGLLGLVLHPSWPEVPRAFVHYSDRNGDTVVSELAGTQSGDGPPVLDAGSERMLLQVDQPYANHNGGQLAFGPDGNLYLGLGDGGDAGDPHGNGQNPATLLGSILRLAVDGGADPYAIPADNPFAAGDRGAREVFLYGLRNPWRFSFDHETGLLWIADVGQGDYEEVDRIDPIADAGANLGWNRMEASHCFVAGCSSEGLVLPVAEYGHDAGCSVTGGHVYRGAAIEGLRGWYLFSDYCSGLLFGLRSDATGVNTPRLLLETGLSVTAFGEDSDGELYLADLRGGIYRVEGGG